MTRFLTVLALFAALAAGCSLPTDDEATLINPDDLPDVLRQDVEIQTENPTEPGPQTVSVNVYLIDAQGERSIVVDVPREVSSQSGFQERISLLFGVEVRTEEEQERAFSNFLREFTLSQAFINDNDVAIIDIGAFDDDGAEVEIGAEVLRNAAAQLVHTASGFPEVRGVRIMLFGEDASLPTCREDTAEVVQAGDYDCYGVDFVESTTTTTTASPTTTVDAEGDG